MPARGEGDRELRPSPPAAPVTRATRCVPSLDGVSLMDGSVRHPGTPAKPRFHWLKRVPCGAVPRVTCSPHVRTKPAARPPENDDRDGLARRRARRPFPDEACVVGVLVLLVFGVGLLKPDFLQTGNLLTTAHNSVYVGLMACGMVFALAMREVDLSVGGMYAMGIVVGALLIRDGWNPWLAALAVLALSALLGALNGAVTTYLRLPSFIVTLATLMLLRGIGLALAQGKQVTNLPQDHAFFRVLGGGESLGVPNAVWVFAFAVIVLTVVFTRTRFGARVRAIGSNPEAAAFGGLPVTRTRIAALALSGLMAGSRPSSRWRSSSPGTPPSARATSSPPSPRPSSAAPR